MNDTLIIIPVRLAATRLPGKPLAEIAGKPMMAHVYEQAVKANIGPVYLACVEEELFAKAKALGINALHINKQVATGTDFVYEAAKHLGQPFKYVINVQGDIPTIKPQSLAALADCIKTDLYDMATIASVIDNDYQKTDPSTVKVVIAKSGKALYFTRSPNVPYGEGPLYHHIGVFAFKYPTLEKFVSLPQTELEKRERLEQLRAMENDISIGIRVVDDNPHGIDTQADLDLVRKQFNA
jgi:3-deoxy-manno-octulosonate cytidylyltransferase (CMP-KDO synthetase)